MKNAATKKTPRPANAEQPSAEASARFKRLVAVGRGTKTPAPQPPEGDQQKSAKFQNDHSAGSRGSDSDASSAPDEPGFVPFATLKDLGSTWIEYLKANDAAVSTWASYQADFETAVEHFGGTTDPATLTPEAVAAYEQSDAVTKTKKGRPKAMPTILKTRRVLRLALKWAHDAGRLATIPYAAC
jgi:hypothetical protein